jgi:hypothetical protein
MENASLREQLDISRREKAQQESDLWRAQESRRQSDEERRAVLLQIEELKTNSSGQSFLPAPSVQRSLVKPPHNVQCTGFTVFTNDDFITATLCFQNVPNGKLLGKFEMPRLRVIYYDKPTGEELADVYPTEWWSDSGDTPTDIGAQEQYALVASFFREHGTWKALEIDEDDLDLSPRLNSVQLPAGDLHIIASLSGTNKLWIPPVEGVLTLGEDGSASFQRTSD